MPDKPTWTERIPDALEQLSCWSDAIVDRKGVEGLFSVSARQAQRILENAGATIEGRLAVISPGELMLYLEHMGGTALARAEKERRARFAQRYAAMRRERVELGAPLLVEVEERQCRPVRRLGYDGLPAGIEIRPGELRIAFGSIEELVGKLALLAQAMQGDGDGSAGYFPEMERRTHAI